MPKAKDSAIKVRVPKNVKKAYATFADKRLTTMSEIAREAFILHAAVLCRRNPEAIAEDIAREVIAAAKALQDAPPAKR